LINALREKRRKELQKADIDKQCTERYIKECSEVKEGTLTEEELEQYKTLIAKIKSKKGCLII
jgi:hypothetical protein